MQNWGKDENAVELELPEGCARGFVWIEICVHHNRESSKPNCVEVGKFKLEYLVELSMATVRRGMMSLVIIEAVALEPEITSESFYYLLTFINWTN